MPTEEGLDMQPMLVTGGTGTLGRPLVALLTGAGRPVRVLSRRPRAVPGGPPVEWVVGDLASGKGLERAVDGAGVIVHRATSPPRARRVDVAGTGRLLAAARRAGSPHLVYISIVGVDRVPFRYYRAKLEAERLVESSPLPWTILRTTQFHDLLHMALAALARAPVLPLPRGLRCQPVETGEVAERLVALALGRPAGRVADLGGPQVLTVEELAGSYLRAAGRRRPLVLVPVPGAARGFRDGGHLCPDHPDGKRTWAEFLAARYQEGR
jgi:uncharacterized protein YbjT (DUF2867 family)